MLTNRFVVLTFPRTGSTFVRAVLRRDLRWRTFHTPAQEALERRRERLLVRLFPHLVA